MPKPASVAAYIAGFPPATRRLLTTLRAAIQQAAPQALECISYNMPAYQLDGPLVYFAGYASHVGFYPTGTGIKAFEAELAPYTWSKGAVQFPLDQPLPLDLVARMVRFKVDENQQKAPSKKAPSKKAPSKKAPSKKAPSRR